MFRIGCRNIYFVYWKRPVCHRASRGEPNTALTAGSVLLSIIINMTFERLNDTGAIIRWHPGRPGLAALYFWSLRLADSGVGLFTTWNTHDDGSNAERCRDYDWSGNKIQIQTPYTKCINFNVQIMRRTLELAVNYA